MPETVISQSGQSYGNIRLEGKFVLYFFDEVYRQSADLDSVEEGDVCGGIVLDGGGRSNQIPASGHLDRPPSPAPLGNRACRNTFRSSLAESSVASGVSLIQSQDSI